MKTRPLFSIILVVFIDLLGFSLIIPLLPYYAQTFNASDTTVGLLLASYAAAQLIGAPLLGRASDRLGRKPILIVSIFGTFLSFLIFGFATSLLVLFYFIVQYDINFIHCRVQIISQESPWNTIWELCMQVEYSSAERNADVLAGECKCSLL